MHGDAFPHLTITLDAAVGSGATELAAFDSALREVGAGNYNLVRLSSVIPPGARLDIRASGSPPPGTGDPSERRIAGRWGDRLYCVYAARTAARDGDQAWAGIGWVTVEDGDGRGLFVEHEGGSRAEVEQLIERSLGDMCAGRPERFSAPSTHVVGTSCAGGEAVCALVIAQYQTAAWLPSLSTAPPLVSGSIASSQGEAAHVAA